MDELTLKEVFDEHCAHLTFNMKLANLIYRYQVSFVSKNQEHMEFFGGNLLGVQVVRFTDRDIYDFLTGLLGLDMGAIKADFHRVKEINMTFKVSSDVFNQTCMYLIHRFLTSPLMNEKQRFQAAKDCALIFNYKIICRLIRDYFKFPADPALAKATYASLSQRYLIKKLGSWQEVMNYRSEELIHPERLHKSTLIKYDHDADIVYLVNDSQGRIRDMVKNIYSEMDILYKSGQKIHTSTTSGVDMDGEEIIQDRVHGLESYTNYLRSVISDQNSFIKQELVDIVANVMHTMQVKGFMETLKWISHHYMTDPEIDDLLRIVLIHSYNYLLDNNFVLHNHKDIAGLLTKLRGVYVNSRSGDEELLGLRVKGAALVTKAIGKTNEQSVAAIRTGLFLYFCLRSYTKHYYTQS
jgi:hypothetical protein